jgi:hypothetical protein
MGKLVEEANDGCSDSSQNLVEQVVQQADNQFFSPLVEYNKVYPDSEDIDKNRTIRRYNSNPSFVNMCLENDNMSPPPSPNRLSANVA